MLYLVAVWLASGATLRVAHAQMLCSDYEGNNMCLGFGDPSSGVGGRAVYDSKGPWDAGSGQPSKQALPLAAPNSPGSNFLQQNLPPWLVTSLGLDKDPETVMVYHGTSGYAWVIAPPEMNPQVPGTSVFYEGEFPYPPNDQTLPDIKTQGRLKGLNLPQGTQRARKNRFKSQNHPQTSKLNGFNKQKPIHQSAAVHHIHPSMNTHKQSFHRQQAIPKAFQPQGSVSDEQPEAARLPSMASGVNLDTGLPPNGVQRNEAYLGWSGNAHGPTSQVNQYQQPVYGQRKDLSMGYAGEPTGAVLPGEYEMTSLDQKPVKQPFYDPGDNFMKQPFTPQSEVRPNFAPGDAAGKKDMDQTSSPGHHSAISVHGSNRVMVNHGAVPGQANVSLSPQDGLAAMQSSQNVPVHHGSLGAKPQHSVAETGETKVEPEHHLHRHHDGLKASMSQASLPQAQPLPNQEPVQAQPKLGQSGSSGTNGATVPALPQYPGKAVPAAQQPPESTLKQAAGPSGTQQPVPGGSGNHTKPDTAQSDALRKVGIIKR